MPLHSAALGDIIGHRERAMRFELDARYLIAPAVGRGRGVAWEGRLRQFVIRPRLLTDRAIVAGRADMFSAASTVRRVGSVLYSDLMRPVRRFVQSSSRGGLLAVCVACSLAIQALMASVGFGMLAGVASDQAGIVLCSLASDETANAPARDHDRQIPNPAPQCPFCFVAAQSAGHVATMGEVPAFPAYAGLQIGAISRPLGDGAIVPQFRHRHGEPRAPPAFSV